MVRRRQVSVQPSCNGTSCPSLTHTASCTRYINVDCVMTSWSAWSLCSNGCGNGSSTRQRSITTSAVCRGRPCGARTETRHCTDYREDRDCVVSINCRAMPEITAKFNVDEGKGLKNLVCHARQNHKLLGVLGSSNSVLVGLQSKMSFSKASKFSATISKLNIYFLYPHLLHSNGGKFVLLFLTWWRSHDRIDPPKSLTTLRGSA